ncbi:hypothetical protein BpHYR1_027559 [Brachionus plicatilis]|uniref:Uncharacterized protein n=1 Tax=Brachionus plicatilis TaxID=10195 RepID=A0A3M7SNQ8_BRAPC|nr:hypothetical protein BpHYR1_027559 [Brachionus plicatilis]
MTTYGSGVELEYFNKQFPKTKSNHTNTNNWLLTHQYFKKFRFFYLKQLKNLGPTKILALIFFCKIEFLKI